MTDVLSPGVNGIYHIGAQHRPHQLPAEGQRARPRAAWAPAPAPVTRPTTQPQSSRAAPAALGTAQPLPSGVPRCRQRRRPVSTVSRQRDGAQKHVGEMSFSISVQRGNMVMYRFAQKTSSSLFSICRNLHAFVVPQYASTRGCGDISGEEALFSYNSISGHAPLPAA